VSFEEYLIRKKIDRDAFAKAEPERFAEWMSNFDQVSEQSFTTQKLYLINPVRRKYPLTTPVEDIKAAGLTSKVPRPVFKPKPKTN
jgi:hypothetical protein